jgi:hypothetical protein
LSVFGKKVLRRIFGSKSEEEAGDWRRLHNEELVTCILYLSLILSQGYEIGDSCRKYEIKNA